MTELVSALSTGALYAIVAIACNIIFIASRVFNFAQAFILMLGTFVAYELSNHLGLPLWATVIVCAIVCAVIGGLEELIAIRWLAGKAGSHSELVTTLGFGLVVGGGVVVFWGNQAQTINYWTDSPVYSLLGGRMALTDLIIIAVAVGLAVGIGVLTRRTTIGLSGLATAEDRQAAMLRGINVRMLAFGAFALAGAIIGAAAPFVAAKTYAVSSLGDALAVKAFVVLAIGGMGSQRGALIGGFALGMIETYASLYLGSEWRDIAAFVVLLIVLLTLPRGIFSRLSARVV